MHAVNPKQDKELEIRLMAGTFADFSADEVLNVLAMSRQCLRLFVLGPDAEYTVTVKAGQVLDAQGGAEEGESAFIAMWSSISDSWLFEIYHVDWTGPFPTPIGCVDGFGERARRSSGRSRGPERARSNPDARTPVVGTRLRVVEADAEAQPSGLQRHRRREATPGPASVDPAELAQLRRRVDALTRSVELLRRQNQSTPTESGNDTGSARPHAGPPGSSDSLYQLRNHYSEQSAAAVASARTQGALFALLALILIVQVAFIAPLVWGL